MTKYAKLTAQRLKYMIRGAVSECQKTKEEYAKDMATGYASYCMACVKANMMPMKYDEWKEKNNG